MPTAIVKISDEANQIINIVKAKYALNDKSEAINKLVIEYGKKILNSDFKPESVKNEKEKSVLIKNISGYFNNFKK
jgi:hypothetical protein